MATENETVLTFGVIGNASTIGSRNNASAALVHHDYLIFAKDNLNLTSTSYSIDCFICRGSPHTHHPADNPSRAILTQYLIDLERGT